MSRIDLKAFSGRWDRMLVRNRIEPPLHISEFMGMGKYAGLYPEFKRALFRDVCKLINEHKLYSISIAISQLDFKTELRAEVRQTLIGPYALAFFSAVALNQGAAERFRHDGKISYLLDEGFGYAYQLKKAHSVIVNLEQRCGIRHT